MNTLIQQLDRSLCSISMLLVFCIPVLLPAGTIVAESEVNIEDVEECVLAGESDRRRKKRANGPMLRGSKPLLTPRILQRASHAVVILSGHRIEHDLLAPMAC